MKTQCFQYKTLRQPFIISCIGYIFILQNRTSESYICVIDSSIKNYPEDKFLRTPLYRSENFNNNTN